MSVVKFRPFRACTPAGLSAAWMGGDYSLFQRVPCSQGTPSCLHTREPDGLLVLPGLEQLLVCYDPSWENKSH
eukprot:2995892-Rhodomonas_salina.1